MGEKKDRGWEDIRGQPAYKDGKKARDMADDPDADVDDVRRRVREDYEKLDKVHRRIYRHGYNDR